MMVAQTFGVPARRRVAVLTMPVASPPPPASRTIFSTAIDSHGFVPGGRIATRSGELAVKAAKRPVDADTDGTHFKAIPHTEMPAWQRHAREIRLRTPSRRDVTSACQSHHPGPTG